MAVTNQQSFFGNSALWAAERYLGTEAEVRRLRACTAAVPAGVRTLRDVGAGNGAFLRVLEELRPELRTGGLERSRTALEMAVCAAEVREGCIDAIPAADRAFDVVTCLEVIEHLPFGVYEASMRELERVASRYLVIEVPYREGIVQVRCPYCACEFNPHYHMRQFDDRAMQELFRDFRCLRLQKIMTRDVVLASVVKPVFRAIRRQFGFFPPLCACPQCGFRAAGPQDGAMTGPDVRERTARGMSLGGAGKRLLPRRNRPLAVIGVYERVRV